VGIDARIYLTDLFSMTIGAKIRLSRLRDIGWRCWDPLHLKARKGDREGSAGVGDYDDYLLTAARMLRRDESDDAAAKYLVWAEGEHMGLGGSADAKSRAEATIRAMRVDDQLWGA
jgi:hypothetical protein